MEEIPVNILELAAAARNDLIPAKSRERYYFSLRKFEKWQERNYVVGNFSEDVVLAYVKELLDKQAPTTVWSTYSMLKSILNVVKGVNIGDYKSVQCYLKSKSKGHKPKQSKVLNHFGIRKFLLEAPDETFLAVKVVLVLGVLGALRCQELVDLVMDDLQDCGKSYIVNVPKDNKTLICRSFTVSNQCYDIVKNYIGMRPAGVKTDRVFLNFRNGKSLKQVIGKNKIAEMPSKIAKFLGLDNVECYTGHCFRRTSATLLALGGGDLLTIKNQGGWKSSACAERYIESSIYAKQKNETLITKMISLDAPDFAEKEGKAKDNIITLKDYNSGGKKVNFDVNFDVDLEFVSLDTSNFAENEGKEKNNVIALKDRNLRGKKVNFDVNFDEDFEFVSLDASNFAENEGKEKNNVIALKDRNLREKKVNLEEDLEFADDGVDLIEVLTGESGMNLENDDDSDYDECWITPSADRETREEDGNEKRGLVKVLKLENCNNVTINL